MVAEVAVLGVARQHVRAIEPDLDARGVVGTRSGFAPAEGALALAREVHNSTIEGITLIGIGQVYLRMDRYEDSLEPFAAALTVGRAMSDPAIEAFSLNHLGVTYRLQARYDESLDHLEQALAISLRIKDTNTEFESRCELGETLRAAPSWLTLVRT